MHSLIGVLFGALWWGAVSLLVSLALLVTYATLVVCSRRLMRWWS